MMTVSAKCRIYFDAASRIPRNQLVKKHLFAVHTSVKYVQMQFPFVPVVVTPFLARPLPFLRKHPPSHVSSLCSAVTPFVDGTPYLQAGTARALVPKEMFSQRYLGRNKRVVVMASFKKMPNFAMGYLGINATVFHIAVCNVCGMCAMVNVKRATLILFKMFVQHIRILGNAIQRMDMVVAVGTQTDTATSLTRVIVKFLFPQRAHRKNVRVVSGFWVLACF